MPPRTVAEHSFDVWEAVRTIADELIRELSGGLGWSVSQLEKEISINLVAALLHDLLKANSSFQDLVTSNSPSTDRQPVRHEIFAAAMLCGETELGKWFAKQFPKSEDRWIIAWSIAGHHRKMFDPALTSVVGAGAQSLFSDRDAAAKVVAYLDHDDIKKILDRVGEPPQGVSSLSLKRITYETADDGDDSLRELVRYYAKSASAEWRRCSRELGLKLRLAIQKALLIAGDVAGSAVPENDERPAEWVSRALRIRLQATELVPVVQKGTKGKAPVPFQTKVGKSQDSATIVVAGCGNGKTTAAYLWAQQWASGRKLFFTYPTTGTATAGYSGYLADQHHLLAELIHSRAEVDLADIKGTTDDDLEESDARIDSLRMWDRKVVVCTVDTVLGLLHNQRRALYSFPAFVSGAFVFDELHSYDRRLFGALLRFLKTFPGIPVLLMSASIPTGRLRRLREVLGNRVGEKIEGDEELEGFKRYAIHRRKSEDSCWREVVEALNKKQKVLWVCNTVADAIKIAREAGKYTSVPPVIYHSRFRYCARVRRQRAVLAEFEYRPKQNEPRVRVIPEASLVIATQVCEMSLDISSDLLVTAECPLPSFVQRLGRLNRYADRDDPWPCLVYPSRGLPYNEETASVDLYGDYRASMMAMREAVDCFASTKEPCSQRDLAQKLDAMLDDEEPDESSSWLDGGWLTYPTPVRAGGQDGITVIWEDDLKAISESLGSDRRKWTASRLAPWTIPMNSRRNIHLPERAGPFPIAPTSLLRYSEAEGAEWIKQ